VNSPLLCNCYSVFYSVVVPVWNNKQAKPCLLVVPCGNVRK
jgi:hypothetical protein